MNDQRNSNGFLARGGAWVVVHFVLMTAVIVLSVMFHGDGIKLVVISTGVALLLGGGGVGIAGVVVLGLNRTPFPQPRQGSQLVKRGIYGVVRHPLYTSVLLSSLGWAFTWQSKASLTAAVVLILFLHAKSRREQRWLHEMFSDYPDYAQRVPRFLPGFCKSSKLNCNFRPRTGSKNTGNHEV